MKIYSYFGINDFIVCLGYKGDLLKKELNKIKEDWNITYVNTGLKTMTGGRIKRIKKHLQNDKYFCLSYGDGLCDVNLKKLINFHKKNKNLVTLTAVRPPARFGAIKIKGKKVNYFKEKSKLDEGWINGGFFVIEPKFLKFIKGDNTFLEREPLETVAKKKQLNAYKHDGFWQCIDTKRDRDNLNHLVKKKKIKL